MHSKQPIIAYVERFLRLTAEVVMLLGAGFTAVPVRKRQLLVQPGFTATHRFFVVQGSFRAYVTTDEGQEHTIQLAIENCWISDYNSYISQQPASMFLVALEDSLVLRISFEEEERLKAASHTLETFFRIQAELSAAFLYRRLTTMLTQTATERYQTLAATQPLLVQRIPQYALASYLGMTTEFLSKIRNRRVLAKVEPVQPNF
jgi:CRP-like cAMP-binding protein